jgi:hypothetical protein
MSPSYRIRLYHPTGKLIGLSPDKFDILHHHFGIFVPRNAGPCIQVIVEKTNLSVLKLTNLSHEASIHTHFNAVWNALKTDLTGSALNKARARWNAIAKEAGAPP